MRIAARHKRRRLSAMKDNSTDFVYAQIPQPAFISGNDIRNCEFFSNNGNTSGTREEVKDTESIEEEEAAGNGNNSKEKVHEDEQKEAEDGENIEDESEVNV